MNLSASLYIELGDDLPMFMNGAHEIPAIIRNNTIDLYLWMRK
jgi:hypothetical protein